MEESETCKGFSPLMVITNTVIKNVLTICAIPFSVSLVNYNVVSEKIIMYSYSVVYTQIPLIRSYPHWPCDSHIDNNIIINNSVVSREETIA